ncbi:TerB family tellurite resistance protein [Kordiimonas lipolytica]|uniref:TerB family tellurite resistance protein n=1 Tax=Kordiimonas lipolytica TaxID=1662421 RepID=A0ABV8UD06_9PROT|nr:TerB family tellurite resistance protein [Kordiimonas lipolytica]
MFEKVSKILGLKGENEVGASGLELATAALLVQVSKADGEFTSDERDQLEACVKEHFDLTNLEAAELLARAERDQSDATCLYAFTRTIAKELDNEERQEIVRLLWRVAFADRHIDNFEENVLAKVSGLLGVSPHDRIRIKQEVQSAQ